MKNVVRLIGCVAVSIMLVALPAVAPADPGNQYCLTPPFITAGLKPNLLLLIDNSASMYDLQYQDTTNTYCANDPTTACTAGSTCAGAATCLASATTTTTSAPAACTSDADCTKLMVSPATDTCFLAGKNKNTCKTAVVTTTTVTPVACTADATCSALTTGDTCNNKCNASRQCYDAAYSTATTYTGYFDATATYGYDFTAGKFTSGASLPAACTYSAGTPNYFCVNTTGTGTTEAVVNGSTGFVASGNFLNWMTASKFDIEKKILTGGKFDTVNNVRIAESRGCGGREFIKNPATTGHCSATTTTSCTADTNCPGSETCSKITFAIRGGTPGGIGSTQSLATEYGQTYIDLYAGLYNASACLSATNDWVGVVSGTPPNLGTFQTDSKSCVGAGTTALNPTNMWNHSLHNCYKGMLNVAGGYSGNLSPLEGECQSVYATVLPSAITDPNSGFAICSSKLSYTIGSTAYKGYLGACWNGTDFTGPCKNPDGTTQTGMTDLQQMINYCTANATTNPVVDPSSSASSVTTASIPGFVMQQGLSNLTKVGTVTVMVGLAAPPTGLIDNYKDRIRFGAMSFQNNGSGSECGGTSLIPCAKVCGVTTTRTCYFDSDCPFVTGSTTTRETCGALAKTDGGKIISYVGAGYCSATTTTPCSVNSDCTALTPSGQYCAPSIGSHGAGLVNSIDAIPATSWTPFAEAFYNAMGYFARMNDYSLSPPTSRSDASFSLLPSPNTATSYDSSKNPSQYRCQSNNILLITDGMSTSDQNTSSEALATLYAGQVPYITKSGTTYTPTTTGYDSAKNHGYDATLKCPTYLGSRSISDLAWVAKNRSIKSASLATTAITTTPGSASESITTYVVYSGPQTTSQPDLCDPKTLMNNTATNGGTTLYSATDPSVLYTQLDAAMSNVAAKAASGTAASILSNSEGSGANILQAVFYPKKIFDNSTSVNWIGEMQNLWYYVDPYIQNSTIREDTDGDLKLNLVNDYVVRFSFDNASDKTMVQRYWDSAGSGVVTASDKVGGLIDPDYVNSIWRAGMKLWARDDTASPRTIYTGYNSSADSPPQKFSNLVADGSLNTSLNVWNALQIPAGTDAQRQALATKLISYVRGTDQAADTAPCLNGDCSYRGRKVTMGVCSGNDQKRCTTATVATDCPSGNTCTSTTSEWKLGDIISSTPRVQSTVRLNTYSYPAPAGYNDKSYDSFAGSNNYKGRGMVYAGANDGMLHAFNLGTLSVANNGFQKASLAVPSGTTLGAEQWAFIPKNSFPYLKYATDNNYSHLYAIDGRTVILDASIGDTNTGTCVRSTYWQCNKPSNGAIPMVDSSNNLDATKNTWRTIVIAGMGQGGASRNNVAAETCIEGATGSCVKTPITDYGYSSYFALDVTDPNSPKFLWEFSDNLLGYSTTAPAIVRIGSKDTNGRWFAVFGNGPFGPIDTGTHQFKGQSDQNLRFFVVDLRTGALVRTIAFDGTGGTPVIANAFSGTLLGGSIDADRRDTTKSGNYQDDAIYAGFVKKATDGTWTDGGIIRIMTKEDQNPLNWVASKVIDGIGPVTTSIARTQDTKNKNLWLYTGTGRYYYRDAATLDDNDTGRSLFGIKEPCYNTAARSGNVLDGSCTTTLAATALVNQTSSVSSLGASDIGWRIDLDAKTASEGAERVVTDSVALTNGTVFFTSFKPSMDICGYGGNSFLWGVKYDTGGQAAASALQGKALIQLSTGEFKEVDLSISFTDKLNRRMLSPMTGKPPSDAPPIISSSTNKPLKKILHIQEH